MTDRPPSRRAALAGAGALAAATVCGQTAFAKAARRRHAAARFHLDPLPSDMALGAADAPVTVVEYASVGCPVCGRWHKEVWPAFKARWIDTGRVRFVFREILVGGAGEQAIAAAGFTLARAVPGRYFEVTDAVFDSQPALFDDPDGVMTKIAARFGTPHDRFEALIRDQAAVDAMDARSQANAKAGGVDSTPTFVVNGAKLQAGYQPLAALDAAIAKARAG